MMSPSNRASWLMAKQSPVNIKLGILLEDYPAILGCDVAGEVVEVHSSLADVFDIGDRVTGAATCLDRKDGRYCYAGFQEFVVLRLPCIAKIPKKVAYEDAVVLPLGINTAASCLFMDETLGLKAPSVDGIKVGRGGILLVWGASSSVGSCGVQMATHAGYEVVGVASRRNHDMVQALGATMCFDQSDPDVVGDIVTYLSGKEVVGAYDAVSNDATLNTVCEILDNSRGRKLVASVMPGAEGKATRGAKIVTNFATDMASSEFFKATWQWLDKVMEENRITYMPPSEVIGNGLEHLQQAADLLAEGVSAKKLVVSV